MRRMETMGSRRGGPVSLLGIPLELGAAEAGSIMGPAALRTAGLPALLGAMGHDVVDRGDLPHPAPVDVAMAADDANVCRNLGQIAAWTRMIHDHAHGMAREGGFPIFLGGDHSLSMGTVSGIARHCHEIGRDLFVLWLDAHADFNTPATTPSGNMHGMSVAFACGDPSLRPLLGDRPFIPVKADNVHLFGLRSIDTWEREAVRGCGIQVSDMRDIDDHGVSTLLQRFIDQVAAAGAHLHVSLDVDFLDPSLAPGVGTTVPGGATYREAHLIMEMLQESGLVGSLDIVELNPFLDERGKSARLLTELTASLFGRTIIDRPARQIRVA
ncbi:arginase [Skermanella stibiiresistens SB22]|uniref:Arginase n=1 Tax=Skermanella stibiiresistens SB22 TaxID=1385369 RepID=W9GYF7_9PROT|nr:arginase [Skermanella stibiiresistens]EWY38970.1 arginase [Skermanella stibiiresistens SB22]